VSGYPDDDLRTVVTGYEATDTGRGKTPARPPADYVPYGDRKPYTVAGTLAALRGPTGGTISLPHHLDWSGHPEYDLSQPGDLASMYRTVLNQAATVDDLNTWLDGEVLVRLWPTLWLPPQLRRRWEHHFPQLAATSVE
jgi:hypothetical protein